MKYFIVFLIAGLILLNNCENKQLGKKVILPEINISKSTNGVVTLPLTVPEIVRDIFVKYTKLNAPNGKPIHFLAQDAWTEDQIVHARNVLKHILTDYVGSNLGNNKALVANSMSEKRATMVLFNDTDELEKAFDGGLMNLDHSMQDLRSNECPAVGDRDYMAHITRDASYEEIWHLVHDYGIIPVLPNMISEMRYANDAAVRKGWEAWPEDEPQEHPNEYVGVLIDNYYDLWITEPKLYEAHNYEAGPKGTTHFGSYFANGRIKMRIKDPLGYQLIEKFFHPYLTYNAQLPFDFQGTFSIKLDESKPYTYKSQHLIDVTLRGDNDANLVGNERENKLKGNLGDNAIYGFGGDDEIDGGEGNDTAVYRGTYNEYEIISTKEITTISDRQIGRDGMDRLKNIEFIQFKKNKILKLSNKKKLND